MKQILILFLLATQLGLAQNQANMQDQTSLQTFSLEEAVTYALDHNYKMINASRDIKDAQLQKWVTISSGLPQIEGNINYSNQLKQPVSLIPAEFSGGAPGTFVPVIFGQPQGAGATLTLRQQIFDGSYIVGIQAVRTFINYSANNQQKTAQEVTKMVTQAYGNVLLAQQGVKVVQNNRDNLAASLSETQQLVANGLAEEEQAEQLQITLANVESQLRNFKRLREISLQLFNLSLGLPIATQTVLSENLETLVSSHTDLGLLAQPLQIENNTDYKLALNLNEQRYFELKLAKSRALPTLTSFVNYGTNGFSDDFSFLNGSQQWFQSSVLGVDLRIPLFSSFGRDATTKRAKIALLKSETQLTEASESIRLQWEQAKSDFTLAVENHLTAKENLALASRIAQKNETKFKEGLASSFELRQAQLQLYTAQQSYLEAMVAVINQKTNLSQIVQPTTLN
ncbi:MAG: TolC family protein [Flavobacteriia bacterium]|nr:TolC family protein [Flavobacteriia bacterium]